MYEKVSLLHIDENNLKEPEKLTSVVQNCATYYSISIRKKKIKPPKFNYVARSTIHRDIRYIVSMNKHTLCIHTVQ